MKKKIFVLLLLSVFVRELCDAQISSPDGTFSSQSTSNLTLQTNTTPRFTILNTNGYVGIGNLNPGYLLDVNGVVNATGLSVNGMPFVPSAWTRAAADIYFPSGRVGIGVTPTEALHINGNVLSNQFLSSLGTFGVSGVNNLSFQTAGVNRLTILNANGNVGIGNSAPEDKLHISGGNLVIDNGNAPAIFTGAGTTDLNRYLQLLNSFALQSPSGLKAGGVLVADNYGYASPSRNDLVVKGKVGIGTPLSSNPNNYTLAVNGIIGARKVQVETASATWPDYVFSSTYRLPSLSEVEAFIIRYNHLKDVPSAEEIEKDGHDLGQMDAILLKKVEELTLYIIQQQKEIDELKKQLNGILDTRNE